jgi:uncharacterized protein
MQTHEPGHCCWVDLAAADAGSARAFYRQLFGWTAHEQSVNGGSFTRLQRAGSDIGSLYQLSAVQIARGVPSHWTPYIRVNDVQSAAERAASLGGQVLVRPFDVGGIARVAVILDSIGAHVGLWQPNAANLEGNVHG